MNVQPTSTVARGALFSPPRKLQAAILENGADPSRADKSDLSSGSSVLWSGNRADLNGLKWYEFVEVDSTFPFRGWAALDEKGLLCAVCEDLDEAWSYSPKSGEIPSE